MHINLEVIEQKVKLLAGKSKYDKEFVFHLLSAYGRAQANITRLRNGQLNIANDKKTEVAQKGIVYFKPTTGNVYTVIDELQTDATVVRYSTRFVIVTDYKKLLAFDTKTNEPLDIDIAEIDKHFAFFLPWAGMEKAQYANENHADVKAAERMAKLFDELVAHNKAGSAEYYHGLNVFFMRLLFCYFAEDTRTFEEGQFTRAIDSYTQKDGSDVARFIHELFLSLDVEDKTVYPAYLAAFPYVNGSLFRGIYIIPEFNKAARDLLLECGKLNWSNVNPDIFGSMIQAVVNPGQRASLGMHYTSVPNILKTVEPLFLNELKEEFNKNFDDVKKLEKLLGRIGAIKVFDPACGSGNFLIIAYKELRKLEHAILERQGQLGSNNRILFSRINIENFYGIEIDDFAHEVAILSLWIAKHQMNLEFAEKFGVELPLIPLKEAGHIVHGNATRLDWNKVCPNKRSRIKGHPVQSTFIDQPNEQTELSIDDAEWDEIYLIGNPPYQGGKKKTKEQADDYDRVFGSSNYSKNLDYISLWFILGAEYISNTKASLAFVSTNSICQGEHISNLWPHIFSKGVQIHIAYASFKWGNSAKSAAAVTCVIVGMIDQHQSSNNIKRIYSDGLEIEANNINPYLVDAPNVIVKSRSKTLSDLPGMVYGNMPLDGNFLKLDKEDRENILKFGDQYNQYIRPLIGGKNLTDGGQRWCLWIDDEELSHALENPLIKDRVGKSRLFRKNAGEVARTLATKAHQFRYRKTAIEHLIVVPRTTTSSREYIPALIYDSKYIVDDSVQVLYDAPLYAFSIIESRMHMVWMRAVGGRLQDNYRYSALLVYNTFPVPQLSSHQKTVLDEFAYKILDHREGHTELSISEMYSIKTMPDDLRKAHNDLDEVVDSIYRKKPFESDEERLAHLFELYEEMTKNERKDT